MRNQKEPTLTRKVQQQNNTKHYREGNANSNEVTLLSTSTAQRVKSPTILKRKKARAQIWKKRIQSKSKQLNLVGEAANPLSKMIQRRILAAAA